MKINLFNHVPHPFTQGWIQLSKKEKIISIALGVLCSPLLGIGGIIAFYAASGIFKSKRIEPYPPLASLPIHSIAQPILSIPSPGNHSALAIATLEKLADSMLEKMHPPHPTIAELPESENQDEWVSYLTNLYQVEPGYFRLLLAEAINSKDADLFKLFSQSIDKENLEENIRILGIPKMLFGSTLIAASPLSKITPQAKKQYPSPKHLKSLILKCRLQKKLPPFNSDKEEDALSYCELIFRKYKPQSGYLIQTALSKGKSEVLSYFLPFVRPEQLKKCIYKTPDKCQIEFGKTKSITSHPTLLKRLPFFDYFLHFHSGPTLELQEEEYPFFQEFHDALFLNVKPRITKENCLYCFTIASKYGFTDLEAHCEQWLLDHDQEMDKDQLFSLADNLNKEKLKALVIRQILNTPQKLHQLSQRDINRLQKWIPSLKELSLPKEVSAKEARFLIPILSTCQHLRKITLKTNDLTLIESLKNLPSLESISLKLTKISIENLGSLEGLPIKKLDLSHTKMNDDLLEYIKELPLQHLDLSHTLIRRLGDLPDDLQVLNLSSTRIIDSSLAHLVNHQLRAINLSRTKITLTGLRYLEGQPIEEINLNATSIEEFSDEMIRIVQTWQAVTSMHILGITIPRSSALQLKAMGVKGHHEKIKALYHVTKLTFSRDLM